MRRYIASLEKYIKRLLQDVAGQYQEELDLICQEQFRLTGTYNFIYDSERYGNSRTNFIKLHPSLVERFKDYKKADSVLKRDRLFIFSYLSMLPSIITDTAMLQEHLPDELIYRGKLKFNPDKTNVKLDIDRFYEKYFYYKILREL